MARHTDESDRARGTLTGWQLAIVAVMSHAPLIVAWVAIPGAFQFGHVVAMPLVYILGGLTLLCAALAFVTMARQMPHAGGLYPLVARGLSPTLGLGVAVLVLVSYIGSIVTLYAVFGLTFSGLVADVTGVDLSARVAAIIGAAIITLISILKLRRVIWFLGALIAMQLAVLVWFDVRTLQLPMAHEDWIAPLQPGWLFSGSFGIALCFAVTAFIGLDTSLNFVGDVRNPGKAVPRAAYIAGATMIAASALSAWAVGAASGGQARAAVAPDADPATAAQAGQSLFTLIARIVGPESMANVARLIMFTLLLATIGTGIVLHKAVGRQLSGLAQDGVLPAAVRAGTSASVPLRAFVPAIAAIGAWAVVSTGDRIYALWLGLASGLGITGALMLTSIAALGWFLRADESENGLVGWEGRAVAGALAAVMTGFVFFVGLTRLTAVFPPGAGRPSWLLPTLIGVAFGTGMVIALVLRFTRPEIYAAIGRGRIPTKPDRPPVEVPERPVARHSAESMSWPVGGY